MIILDEQLLGHSLELEIAKWYKGQVQFIMDLRPDSIIKDDAIPDLLRQQKQPTFVTINDIDFWRKVAIDNQFCVVCFAFSDSRAREISGLLKWLFQQSEFKTKAKRMGKVIRVTGRQVSYYTVAERTIKTIILPGSAWSRPNVGLLSGRKR